MQRLLTVLVPLVLLGAGTLLLAPRATSAPARTPVRALASPGPGGVLELHRRLFAALEAHDREAALTVLDVDRKALPVSVVLFDGGPPLTARTRDGAAEALIEWAARTGSGTRIVRQQVECPSTDLSYAVLELERVQTSKDGTRRLRRFHATSLVREVEGRWKLFHWHVSPAEDDGQLLKG